MTTSSQRGLVRHVLGNYHDVKFVSCGNIGHRKWSCRIEERNGKVHVKDVNSSVILHAAITFAGAPGFAAHYDFVGRVGECHVTKLPLLDSVELTCHERGRPVHD